jgi:hypothetical protein
MDADWFVREVRERTRGCSAPPLVTTATDGDNGGWFCNLTPGSTFWDKFYHPLLDGVRSGVFADIRPSFIHDYIDRHGAEGEVIVRAGAWNTGDHSGVGFVQWTGSPAQRAALALVRAVSGRVRARRDRLRRDLPADGADRRIEPALWRVLRAETSCHFFWGEAWLDRCHADLDAAMAALPPDPDAGR